MKILQFFRLIGMRKIFQKFPLNSISNLQISATTLQQQVKILSYFKKKNHYLKEDGRRLQIFDKENSGKLLHFLFNFKRFPQSY